jgi:hypothetical protein
MNGIIDIVKEFIPVRNIKIYDYFENIAIQNDFPEFCLRDPNFSSSIGAIRYIYNLHYKDSEFEYKIKRNSSRSSNFISKILDLLKI